MLGSITILSGQKIPRNEYLAYRASLGNTDEDTIKVLLRRCETGSSDFPADFPEHLYALAEAICEDVKRSGGDVDPVAEETIHQHTHAAPQTPPEPPEEVEVLPMVPNTETLILEAARGAKLESNGYSRLREVFTFSDDMANVIAQENAIVTPEDWGALLGFSVDLGRKSLYLMGTAVNALEAQGHENAVVQLAGEFGIHYSTLSNAARMCQRVPVEKRVGLYPSVVQEIATKRYDKDDARNQEIILEMVEMARENKWSCEEARSHANERLGRDTKQKPEEPTKKDLQEKLHTTEAILRRFLTHYCATDSPPLNDLRDDVREYFRGNVASEGQPGKEASHVE